jgi:hypothetical protein
MKTISQVLSVFVVVLEVGGEVVDKSSFPRPWVRSFAIAILIDPLRSRPHLQSRARDRGPKLIYELAKVESEYMLLRD